VVGIPAVHRFLAERKNEKKNPTRKRKGMKFRGFSLFDLSGNGLLRYCNVIILDLVWFTDQSIF